MLKVSASGLMNGLYIAAYTQKYQFSGREKYWSIWLLSLNLPKFLPPNFHQYIYITKQLKICG